MPKKRIKKSVEKPDENKKKTSAVTPEGKTGSDEKEKNLYLIQIRYLTEELERFHLKCDELQKQNDILLCEYNTLKTEKKDITEYLKHSLMEKDDELDKLSVQLENQQRAANQERDALLLEHSRQKTEAQKQIDELNETNRRLVRKLADVEEFERQKEELMTSFNHLKKQLDCQKEEHKDEIHLLEMKALLEKSRLEEEMERHSAAVAANVQHLVELKLPETIRSVLQENVEAKARFSQLVEQVQVLMEENAALRERKSELSVEVEILEQTVREAARSSCIRKKELQQLTGQNQQLQEELKAKQQQLEQLEQQLEQLQSERSRVLAELEALRTDKPGPSSQSQQDRLRPSDTCVGPRPTPKTKGALCRSAAGPGSTTVPLHRKPIGQKTTTSQRQTQSAVGFLTSQHLFNKLKCS